MKRTRYTGLAVALMARLSPGLAWAADVHLTPASKDGSGASRAAAPACLVAADSTLPALEEMTSRPLTPAPDEHDATLQARGLTLIQLHDKGGAHAVLRLPMQAPAGEQPSPSGTQRNDIELRDGSDAAGRRRCRE